MASRPPPRSEWTQTVERRTVLYALAPASAWVGRRLALGGWIALRGRLRQAQESGRKEKRQGEECPRHGRLRGRVSIRFYAANRWSDDRPLRIRPAHRASPTSCTRHTRDARGGDGFGQRCHRDIEREQPRRAVVEPLANDLRRPGVLGVEGQRGIEVGEVASRRSTRTKCVKRIVPASGFAASAASSSGQELGLHPRAVFVEVTSGRAGTPECSGRNVPPSSAMPPLRRMSDCRPPRAPRRSRPTP